MFTPSLLCQGNVIVSNFELISCFGIKLINPCVKMCVCLLVLMFFMWKNSFVSI